MWGDEKGIDVVTGGDRNVVKRRAEKILQYKDCTVEIERMWTVNVKVIPVMEGGTGTVWSDIAGKGEIKELQKTAILGTAHCGKCCCKGTEHI